MVLLIDQNGPTILWVTKRAVGSSRQVTNLPTLPWKNMFSAASLKGSTSSYLVLTMIRVLVVKGTLILPFLFCLTIMQLDTFWGHWYWIMPRNALLCCPSTTSELSSTALLKKWTQLTSGRCRTWKGPRDSTSAGFRCWSQICGWRILKHGWCNLEEKVVSKWLVKLHAYKPYEHLWSGIRMYTQAVCCIWMWQ